MFRKIILLLVLIWGVGTMIARQQKDTREQARLAIDQKNWKEADRILGALFRQYRSTAAKDSFYVLLYEFAELGLARGGVTAAVDSVNSFIRRARDFDSSTAFLRQLWLDAAEFYANIGQTKLGFDAGYTALQLTLAEPRPEPLVIAQINYNLGVYSQRMGQVQASEDYHRKALEIRSRHEGVDQEDLYMSYNAVGAIHWYASRYDSSAVYFRHAIDVLDRMPPEMVNSHFRKSIVLNNLAGLYSQLGRLTDAIKAQEESVRLGREFINDPRPHPKKASALAGLYEGIDNLGGLYKQVGDFRRAGDLLHYSHARKTEVLDAGHDNVFISEVLLGQYYTDIREYETALEWLRKGLSHLEESEGDYLFWEADACRSLARCMSALGRIEDASAYYNKAEGLLEQSYQGEYDNIYLDFVRDASLFWAAHGELDRAEKAANKAYKYIIEVQGAQSLGAFNQLINLSELYGEAGQYENSLRYAQQGIATLKAQVGQANNRLDSIRMQMYQPLAILLREKARYALSSARDSGLLSDISRQLNAAIEILEQRKVILDDPESINVLMSENASLIEFAQQIEMELYQLTGQVNFLDRFINLHESFLYSRIRSRLDKADAARFANLPDSIVRQERLLKTGIAEALKTADASGFDAYQAASQAWARHLEKIRKEYPDYYQMRYARFTQNTSTVDSLLGKDETLLRYYEVAGKWYVLVLSTGKRKLLELPVTELNSRIETLYSLNQSDSVPAGLLYSLYRDIWAPVASEVQTKKLIIVPDGILFALSFDMLPDREINSYADLQQHGLIARHAISYQYSLFLVRRQGATTGSTSNFVAFVPGFDQESKKRYLKQQPDSVFMDNQYLKLLAQPNTRKMAGRLKDVLGGRTFTDDASTVSEFKRTANGHHLVLIGTHAEYDNANPDRSRLIFIKDRNGSDSNALFLEDIYACQVESDLTILTACESGKPGYRDGEGMVSLAHAFNYAGSRNILMGLWKIDEKSSSQITEKMVTYLQQGMTGAEALRLAKLEYLSEAPGRTLAPVYWAGLVMMGDASSIQFSTTKSTGVWVWVLVFLALTAGVYGFYRRKADRRKHL
jgi:CHAT domain-containing protein